MLFNSFAYLIFLPIVIIIYFFIQHKYRWILLLSASIYFYMYFIPYFILILVGTILVDYFAGILIESSKKKHSKKIWLITSLIANIGCLAVFKYYNFINENLSTLLDFFGVQNQIPFLHIILPIGLSFHTFQAMSYTIEVYRGGYRAERHLGYYALYVLYFPQLVAGPIERPQNVLHQLHRPNRWSNERFISGLRLIMWGLFKKVVIADNIAVMVNKVYNSPHDSNSSSLLIATYLFAFQIYCDFSGYSDIAIGSSRIFGIHLMKNFNNPYIASSIKDFWRRWHISLSTWFRDYLYIPLGGSRKGKNRHIINLMIIFIVSGIWHGANWTFVIWGGLHALYMVFTFLLPDRFGIGEESTWKNSLKKWGYTFLTFHAVCLAWVFFRADNVENGVFITNKILRFGLELFVSPTSFLTSYFNAITSIGIINWTAIFTMLYVETQFDINRPSKTTFGNFAYFIILFLAISILGKSTQEMFIYFQF